MTFNFEAKSGKLFLNSNEISLRGINWFGTEGDANSVHALWANSANNYVALLKNNGFNCIRMTISAELMLNLDTYKIQYSDSFYNPNVNGMVAGKFLDSLVKKLSDAGILIVFNMHNLKSSGPIDALWYTGEYPESKLIKAWETLTRRYLHSPNVFGADLINEPHSPATWGGDPKTDWASAVERIGNAILKVNPKTLIFAAGVTSDIWGDDINHALTRPIKLNVANRVVYSNHCYKHWKYPNKDGFNNKQYWDRCFGNVIRSGKHTVVIGEFGYSEIDNLDSQWVNEFKTYLNGLKFTNVMYWAFNGNSGGNQGLLKADFKTVVPQKLALIKAITPNPTKFNFSLQPIPTPAPPPVPVPPPTPVPKPTPTPSPISELKNLQITQSLSNSWTNGVHKYNQMSIKVKNTSTKIIKNAVILGKNFNIESSYNVTFSPTMTFTFPSWLVTNGGLKPTEEFTFGFVSIDKIGETVVQSLQY
jgi:endoglucanase